MKRSPAVTETKADAQRGAKMSNKALEGTKLLASAISGAGMHS